MTNLLQSVDSEKTIIASSLYHESLFSRISDSIKSEDFFHNETRYVYSLMEKLKLKSISVNILTVANEAYLQSNETVDREYLEELMTTFAVDEDSALDIVAQVTTFSAHRTIQIGLELVLNDAKKHDKSIEDIMQTIEKLVISASQKTVNTTGLSGEALINDFHDWLNSGRSEMQFTGIDYLDSTIKNLEPGELLLVAARPGVGKTTLLGQSALRNVAAGKRAAIISMEMSPSQLTPRLIANLGKIDSEKITNFKPSNLDPNLNSDSAAYIKLYADVLKQEQWIIDHPLFLETAAPYDLTTVLATIRKLRYINKVDIVYVDYIQLITINNSKGSRNDEITTISRKLKNLAGELGIPIVCAAQLNRAVENRIGNRPTLADLRDSGSLEQDASIVMFIYANIPKIEGMSAEEEKAHLDALDRIDVVLDIAKHRSGKVGQHKAVFDKTISTFSPIGTYNQTSLSQEPESSDF